MEQNIGRMRSPSVHETVQIDPRWQITSFHHEVYVFSASRIFTPWGAVFGKIHTAIELIGGRCSTSTQIERCLLPGYGMPCQPDLSAGTGHVRKHTNNPVSIAQHPRRLEVANILGNPVEGVPVTGQRPLLPAGNFSPPWIRWTVLGICAAAHDCGYACTCKVMDDSAGHHHDSVFVDDSTPYIESTAGLPGYRAFRESGLGVHRRGIAQACRL